jgi:replicative DNA helicase
VKRLIVAETELPHDRIKNGKLAEYEWEQLQIKLEKLYDSPIFIDDTPALSIFELRAKCRRLLSQHKIDIVMVDYLQLMTGPTNSGNREQEVSNISRSLKALAKELSVPIVTLSQLNRSVEQRAGDKRPQLSDLRESGAIEQDADMVFFIHRPEYYGLTQDADGNDTKGLAELIIAKHRNGETGIVPLKFKKDLAQFTDWDSFSLPEEIPGEIIVKSRLSANNDSHSSTDSFLNEQNPDF